MVGAFGSVNDCAMMPLRSISKQTGSLNVRMGLSSTYDMLGYSFSKHHYYPDTGHMCSKVSEGIVQKNI